MCLCIYPFTYLLYPVIDNDPSLVPHVSASSYYPYSITVINNETIVDSYKIVSNLCKGCSYDELFAHLKNISETTHKEYHMYNIHIHYSVSTEEYMSIKLVHIKLTTRFSCNVKTMTYSNLLSYDHWPQLLGKNSSQVIDYLKNNTLAKVPNATIFSIKKYYYSDAGTNSLNVVIVRYSNNFDDYCRYVVG